MLVKPCISEAPSAPAFGGFLAWLRGCGVAFLMEIWFGRALYRQMVATMETLDRMLAAWREGSLRPVTRESAAAPITASRTPRSVIAGQRRRVRRRDADGVACAIGQTAPVRVSGQLGSCLLVRVDHGQLRRVRLGESWPHVCDSVGIFRKSRSDESENCALNVPICECSPRSSAVFRGSDCWIATALRASR